MTTVQFSSPKIPAHIRDMVKKSNGKTPASVFGLVMLAIKPDGSIVAGSNFIKDGPDYSTYQRLLAARGGIPWLPDAYVPELPPVSTLFVEEDEPVIPPRRSVPAEQPPLETVTEPSQDATRGILAARSYAQSVPAYMQDILTRYQRVLNDGDVAHIQGLIARAQGISDISDDKVVSEVNSLRQDVNTVRDVLEATDAPSEPDHDNRAVVVPKTATKRGRRMNTDDH